MNENMMTVAAAKQVLGKEVPKFLIVEHWKDGKFICEIVIREQLEKHMARGGGKAARDASNAAFLARPRLRAFNSREEQE